MIRDGPLFFWRGGWKILKKIVCKHKSANKLFAHIEKRKKIVILAFKISFFIAILAFKNSFFIAILRED